MNFGMEDWKFLMGGYTFIMWIRPPRNITVFTFYYLVPGNLIKYEFFFYEYSSAVRASGGPKVNQSYGEVKLK